MNEKKNSPKKILRAVGIVLVIGALSVLALVVYGLNKVPQAEKEAREKAQDALARSLKNQVLLSTELYYEYNKILPKKISDLFSPLPDISRTYLAKDTPRLDLINYLYIDAKNAEVCLVFDSPLEQKCQRYTAD